MRPSCVELSGLNGLDYRMWHGLKNSEVMMRYTFLTNIICIVDFLVISTHNTYVHRSLICIQVSTIGFE